MTPVKFIVFVCREKDYILPPSEQHMQLCVSVKQVVNLVLKQWNISTEDQLLQWLVKLHIDACSSGTGDPEPPWKITKKYRVSWQY